jgi:hypothetical protein
MFKHGRWLALAAFLMITLGTGCHDDDKTGTDAAGDVDGVDGDGSGDTGQLVFDSGDGPDSNPPVDTTPAMCPGAFGCPCGENSECDDELCIEGFEGNLCTRTCVASCPDGFGCLNTTAFGPDPISVCVPQHTRLCRPCRAGTTCQNPFDPLPAYCLVADDPAEGSFCGSSCANTTCPNGFECKDVPVDGGATAKQCVPSEDAICTCRPGWADLGYSTACEVTNALGSCPGTRACESDGLTACLGTEAVAETCDGVDNDCDGETDNLAPVACVNSNAFGGCVGVEVCDGEAVVCDAAVALPETCDGVDNNCDGAIDEAGCDDALECTVDVCLEDASCSSTLLSGFCRIDGACVADGAVNPEDLCEVCNPFLNIDGWSLPKDTCEIAGACVADGVAKPDDPCSVCAADVSITGWTVLEEGANCDDGEACTYATTCQSNQCIGTRNDDDCADAFACTVDMCNGDGSCANPPVTGSCFIDNVCYLDGDVRPGAPCQVCRSAADPLGWTNAQVTVPCDDESVCTLNDTCDAAGLCVGERMACDDTLDCTQDLCDPVAGCQAVPVDACVINGACVAADDNREVDQACVACLPEVATNTWSVRPGQCFIDDACVPVGTVNPAQPCERCVADSDQSTWTPVSQGSCGDPSVCSAGGQCVAGTCVGAVDACEDGFGCTTGACDAVGGCTQSVVGGQCFIDSACYPDGTDNPADACLLCDAGGARTTWSDNAGRCFIGETCYAAGDANPANPCEICTPAADRTGWTSASTMTACDDQDACSTDDHCDGAGGCVGDTGCDDSLGCTTDLCTNAGCVNIIAAGSCVIDDGCVDATAARPGNSCQSCQPAVAQEAWSNEAVTATCNDGDLCSSDDHCDGAGTCVGDTGCDDGIFCTNDQCGPGGCSNTIDTAWCVIDDACFQADATLAQGCLVCDPLQDNTAWSAVQLDTPCNDASPCSLGERCNGMGQCVGDTSCNDDIICTLDSCDPLAGCSNDTADDFCLIGGQCYSEGFAISNGCATCRSADSKSDWTSTADGTSCDNGNVCTQNAACDGDGLCLGDSSCDDGDPCTIDECTQAGCVSDRIVADKCIIDGVCVGAGPKDDNTCLACAPGTTQTAWTPRSTLTLCNDASPCSTDDHCDGAGSCTGDTSCGDGVACTDDLCGAGGCSNPVSDGACLIGGACRAEGPNPQNACQVCDNANDDRDWTNATLGAMCSDNSACSTDDACNGLGQCVGNTGCNDGQACTVDTCTARGCNNSVIANGWCRIASQCFQTGANPSNVCEVCSPQDDDDAWTGAPTSTGCSDGSACSSDDHCNGSGSCIGDTDCNDGLSCTLDLCNNVSGCDNSQLATGTCLIGGQCYGSGPNPNNPCEICNPAANSRGWTSASTATSCNDGSLCSTDDHCDGSGGCTGDTTCNDSVACTTDRCLASGCDNSVITNGWCRIGRTCVTNGSPNAANVCERCDANADNDGWTPEPVTKSCNDNNGCSPTSACNGAGSCVGDTSCNDGLSCTTDACNGGFGGFCTHTTQTTKCLIDGVCRNSGTAEPGTQGCSWCNPAASRSAWVDRNGISCTDGDVCSVSDTCSGGTCNGSPDIDSYESGGGNNTKTNARYIGSVPDSDGWGDRKSFTANLYPTGDEDWYRFKDDDNSNLSQPHPRVRLSNIPSGRDYDLCVYWQCDEVGDGQSVDCELGTASSDGGMPGCCSRAGGSTAENVQFKPNCRNGGTFGSDDETGNAYVRVYRFSGGWICNDYTLEWGDD